MYWRTVFPLVVIMSAFRFRDERTTLPIIHIKWNPRMDLAALVHINDDICLHRLVGWQRVWSLSLGLKTSSSSQQSRVPTVSDIEWRPDGRVLAVAFKRNILQTLDIPDVDSIPKHSSIALIEIESSQVLHVLQLEGLTISCLNWVCKPKDMDGTGDDVGIYMQDLKSPEISLLLRPLKPLSKGISSSKTQSGPVPFRSLTEDSLKDLMLVAPHTSLHVLSVGTLEGKVVMYSLGLMKVCEFDSNTLPMGSPILSVALSNSLEKLTVIQRSEADSSLSLKTFSVPTLSSDWKQVLAVSLIYAQVVALSRYIEEAMSAIHEAWEDIVLEMETKLSMYFKPAKTSTDTEPTTPFAPTADEWMGLLAFGTTTPGLESFLKEMGEKGLKKLGNSIEITYTNVQKIVVLHLETVCYHLFVQLNHLKGMSLWEQEFSNMGLSSNHIMSSIKSLGAFIMKCTEFQQVIDSSVCSIKVFFKWLYSVMYKLYGSSSSSDTTTPLSTSELLKICQQDYQTVMQFIDENFDREECEESSKEDKKKTRIDMFTLDSVGQYLKDEPLKTIVPNHSPWTQWVKERFPNQEISLTEDVIALYPHDKEKSLQHQYTQLTSDIKNAFSPIVESMSQVKTAFEMPLQTFVRTSPEVSFSHTKNSLKIKRGPLLTSHVTNITTGTFYSAIATLPADSADAANTITLIKQPASMQSDSGPSTSSSIAAEVSVVKFSDSGLETMETSSIDLSHRAFDVTIYDLEFYDTENLFLLLKDSGHYFLAKVPIHILMENCTSVLAGTSWRHDPSSLSLITEEGTAMPGVELRKIAIPTQKWYRIAVSGARRVACIASGRKIRVFETDADEDDEMAVEEEVAEGDNRENGEASEDK